MVREGIEKRGYVIEFNVTREGLRFRWRFAISAIITAGEKARALMPEVDGTQGRFGWCYRVNGGVPNGSIGVHVFLLMASALPPVGVPS